MDKSIKNIAYINDATPLMVSELITTSAPNNAREPAMIKNTNNLEVSIIPLPDATGCCATCSNFGNCGSG